MKTNPAIKVRDVAYPRMQAPDLDAMEAFLLDFGMVRAERTAETLYLRGWGSAQYVHVVHRGDPGLRGFAFEAASRDDLDRVAARDGFTPVRAIDAPGGGWCTSTRDPDGLVVEVVFGIEPACATVRRAVSTWARRSSASAPCSVSRRGRAASVDSLTSR
jgi:hypothetical protein